MWPGLAVTFIFLLLDLRAARSIRWVSAVLAVAVAAAGLFWVPRQAPWAVAFFAENGVVEWATVVVLLAGVAVTAQAVGRSLRRREVPWAAGLALAVLLVFVLEELDWGQRVCGFVSPRYFMAHNRHAQTNLHGLWGYLPERLAVYGLFAWFNLAPRLLRYRPAWFACTPRCGERLLFNGGLAFDLLNGLLSPRGATLHPLEESGELLAALALALLGARCARHARDGAGRQVAPSVPGPAPGESEREGTARGSRGGDAGGFFDRLSRLLGLAILACFVAACVPGRSVPGMKAAGGAAAALALLTLARLAVPAWRPRRLRALGRTQLTAGLILLPGALASSAPAASLCLSGLVLAALIAVHASWEAFSCRPSGPGSWDGLARWVTLAALAALAMPLVARGVPLAGTVGFGLAPAGAEGAQPFEHVLSFVLLLAFPLTVQAAARRAGAVRLAFAAAAAALAAGVVLSGSRAAWVACACSVAVLAWPAGWRRRRLLPLLAGLFTLVLLLAPGAVRRAATLADPVSGTARQRLAQWGGAAALLAERPLLGIGPGTFGRHYRLPRAEGGAAHPCPHNLYLHVAVECGLPALVLFLAAVGRLWRALRGAPGAADGGYRRAALASLAGLLAFGLFDL